MRKSNNLTKNLASGNLQLPDGYKIPHHGHRTSFKSIRKDVHRNREIRIETTYKILIDKVPLDSHTTVLDDGSVHCHDFPNYSFNSAMDMARKIVDVMVDFSEPNDELSEKENLTNEGHH